MRFALRDAFWLTLIVALVCWALIERRRYASLADSIRGVAWYAENMRPKTPQQQFEVTIQMSRQDFELFAVAKDSLSLMPSGRLTWKDMLSQGSTPSTKLKREGRLP